MLTHKAFAAALLPFLLLSLLPAASAAPGTKQDSREIRRVIAKSWEALGEHDLDAFRTFCSDNWNLFTASGNRFSAERLFEIHRTNIRNFRLDATNMEVNVKGDFAWATYDAAMSGERQGEPWGGRFLMTQIFARTSEGWQCVHTHESRQPEQD